MISFLLVVCAAVCNSFMDTISYHWNRSIFSKINSNNFWYKWFHETGWKLKYIDWDKGNKERVKINIFGLLWINKPVHITDAWHFFKSLMIIFLFLSILFYVPFFTFSYVMIGRFVVYWIDFLVMGLCWNLVFSLFYNRILAVGEKK